MPFESDGQKQYVQFLRKGLVGVDAKTGKFLWRYAKTIDMGANILTPVIAKNTIFSAGSRSGGGLVEIKVNGAAVEAKEVYFEKSVAPSIGGAVLVDGYLYGTGSTGLFCADFATGKVKWTERGVGAASLIYAEGMLYVRGHGSEIALVAANPEKYTEKGRFKQPSRSKVQGWPHPSLANGGFYVRDENVLLCFDVKDKK
jgi:outer membrane protein assembly factor BamB